jgi:hypothetical protein
MESWACEMSLKTRTLAFKYPEECRYEPDQIYSRRRRALCDCHRLYTAHAAVADVAVARIAVAAEFAAGSAGTACFESAEHPGYQSQCSAGIADAAEPGTTEIVEISR